MCETGVQLEAAWRSTSTQYHPGDIGSDMDQFFVGTEPIQNILKRERERVEYQTALENYRQHIKGCPVCKPEKAIYYPY